MKKAKNIAKQENRKGLSDVVATVLIILLALAAIAIVWAFVNPSISNTATVTELQSRCFTTELKVNSCDDTTRVITYELVKGKSDGVVGICTTSGGATATGKELRTDASSNVPDEIFETGTVVVSGTGCSTGDVAKVAAVMVSGETEVVC